jgi:hypothetical protein
MASRTSGERMPRARIWRATISLRAAPKLFADALIAELALAFIGMVRRVGDGLNVKVIIAASGVASWGARLKRMTIPLWQRELIEAFELSLSSNCIRD